MKWYYNVVILENEDSCVRLLILLRKVLILSTNSNVIADILFDSLKTVGSDYSICGMIKHL